MRVLVEQTESEVRLALERIGRLWGGTGSRDGTVSVHLLMGGANAGQWHLHPERNAVLIGTQDMLLSRALNRGYASPRARWPMEFGLLNQDALWVMDEVQLMDAGLATSGQLQAFRNEDQDAGKALRSCATWWMSSTLQEGWLKKSPDTNDLIQELSQATQQIEPEDRTGRLWDVEKPLKVVPFPNTGALARDISQRHRDSGCGDEGLTLAVLNTVKDAVEVWKKLRSDKALKEANAEIHLVHSRFRPADRTAWAKTFLNRGACAPGTNRIIVATQVIEAGVDISASLLISELAPWTSLVQRFGRCARWGGTGQIIVADFEHESDKKAAPYTKDELDVAREACHALQDVGPTHLERFEKEHRELLPRLYPYAPKHLLLRHELDELFDTSPDLSGTDIDISRFIRSGDERDVQVFWSEGNQEGPSSSVKPTRDELCSVPFLAARDWLCGKGKSQQLQKNIQAWVWERLEREWRSTSRRDIFPGQTILVACKVGGYRQDQGWDPKCKEAVEPVQSDDQALYTTRACWKRDDSGWRLGERQVRIVQPEDNADDTDDDESLSITDGGESEGEQSVSAGWQTIGSHGLQVAGKVREIAAAVAPSEAGVLQLAGRWHDLGKAHAAFQNCMKAAERPQRDDIAKAPDAAWPCSPQDMYRISASDQRRGFRHELASTLGLFAVLQRHAPDHGALLGPWRDWFSAIGGEYGAVNDREAGMIQAEPTAVEREILDLGADEFDLLAYLVCAHHGKVRMTWHASPADQKANEHRVRIRGIREGDTLPPVALADSDGTFHNLPASALDLSPSESGLSPLTGSSWTERVLKLLERFGPFTLAWMETLLRAADQRASMQAAKDDCLGEPERERDGLERGSRSLASATSGRTAAAASGSDSRASDSEHGDGGGASGRGQDSGTNRPPHSATRYIETSAGILSYSKLAPLLADRVADTQFAISNRETGNLPIFDLLLDLHGRICGDLTPDMAKRWRLRNVRVGEHEPPPYWQVPMLMRNYADDLEARLGSLGGGLSERLIDDLAFAEGQFLHIHPFEDFNGRVSRLFLIELLHRLKLPVADPTASSSQTTKQYFDALRAYDQKDFGPLARIWRQRLSGAGIQ